MDYDLISLGEPLLRLSPTGFGQLRRASRFDAYVVGSQLNVAADFARLGGRAAFLTKLPENPLGSLTVDVCAGCGLDVSHIRRVPGGKMGVTYVEFSAAPRAPRAVYDRTGSAASTISPEDFPWDELASRTRYAYTDGILPGLSESCRRAAGAFLEAARKRGCVTCFDVNYRRHLWTPESAKEMLGELLPLVDVLVTNRNVSEAIFGYGGSDEEILRRTAGDFGCRVVCLTSREMSGDRRGAWASRAISEERILPSRRREFDVVDRYGTGDAWFAGFLYGHMRGDIGFALDYGNALCALAHTVEGDVAHFTAAEVEAVMGEGPDTGLKR